MAKAVDEVCLKASQAVKDGYQIIILSDRGLDHDFAPIPSLLATAGVHHHLIRQGERTKTGLIIESGEPREVHHFGLLLGYGANAINPYLAFESLDDMIRRKVLPEDIDHKTAVKKYIKAANKGIVKVMSKMGISTIQSYRGAQIFEAVGLYTEFIGQYFTWTATRIQGIGIDEVALESAKAPGSLPGKTLAGIGPGLGRQVPMAPGRGKTPFQSGYGAQASKRGPYGQL